MKKKFLILIFVFVCAVFCAFAVSACTSSDNSHNGGTEGDITDIGGSTDENDGNGSDDGSTGAGDDNPDNGSSDDDGKDNTENKEPEHRHLYNVTYTTSTCTEPSYAIYKCECGDTLQEIIGSANGHYRIYYDGVSATCTESGYKDYVKCYNCDYTTYEEIKPLGHDLVYCEGAESTCARHGWLAYEQCSRCDYTTFTELPLLKHECAWTANRSYCAYTCTDCGFVENADLHNFVDGECLSCGYAYNSYLDIFNGVYGYEYFGTMENSESLQALYRDIDYEVRAFHDNGENVSGDCFAEVDYSALGLTADDAIKVWKTYRADNPLYYWLSGSLNYTVEKLYLKVYEEYADGATRTAYNENLYSVINEWVKSVEINCSAYTKTLAFHDLIIEAVDYAYDESGAALLDGWAHSIVGVFDGKGAVCEGYAKTFQLLLNVCGVENIFVTGTGGNEAHAWNLVKLDDGEWYWYDLTWDDTPNVFWGISYNYFASTDDNFLKRHTPSTSTGSKVNFLYYLPVRSQTAYAATESELKKTFETELFEFTIIGYNLVSLSDIYGTGDIVIPSSANYGGRDYIVASIGKYNKYGGNFISLGKQTRNSVTSVFIPASIKFIADNSFVYWGRLKEINVAENNTAYCSVDGVMFTKDRDIILLYPNAHSGTSYSIPDGTTKIGYHAFGTNITGERILESLTVPASVTVVGIVDWGNGFRQTIAGEWNNIVNSLTGRQELIIDENNSAYKVINNLIMSRVYGHEGYAHVQASMPRNETVIIPDGAVSAEDFHSNKFIKTVVFPEGWTSVKNHLFLYCTNLESVYLPGSVKTIGNDAFFGCTSLRNVTISEGVTTIGEYAFYNCGLREVVIPDSVKSIGDKAFGFCHNLISVTLGSGLEKIGEEAFKNCNKLIEVCNLSKLEITKGSTENGYVGYYAENIFSGEGGESLLTVTEDGLAFWQNEGKCYLMAYEGEQTEIVLPESFNGSAYDIYCYAFYESKITSIVIPDCVKIVGAYSFYKSNLTKIDFGNGVTTIERAAFEWCGGLESITLPVSVTAIKDYAFYDCGTLMVYVHKSQSEWQDVIEINAFAHTYETVIFINK